MTTALDTAFKRLDALDLSRIQSTGDWDLGRMFSHLAQGVEFSLDGYPHQKHALFQATLGKAAFTLFDLRGRMSHGLNEKIPGEIVAQTSAEDGLQRLYKSLETFRDHDHDLHPHFAFGQLSKDRFARAHLLHIDNHLEEIAPR